MSRPLYFFFFAIIIMTLAAADVKAQSIKEHLQRGDRSYQKKDYKNALKNYLEALALDADHVLANFRAGISCMNEADFSQAVTYLEKAYQLQPAIDPQIDYHLAMAYQENHQFTKAVTHFEAFKQKYKDLSGVANQKIAECMLADSLMNLPVNATVRSLESLNSSFSESFPLVAAEGALLLFTSNRSDDDYLIKSGTNFDDVYVVERMGAAFNTPAKIGGFINVNSNDAAISISHDGKTLLLYYEGGKGDIYTSTNENGEWSQPVALNRFINHPHYRESGACLSPDGNKLFFSSNRPGGKGGYDIYVCERGSNGDWGRPSNLGSTVNTRYDEEFPFLHADGETLYFSSNGHPSVGSHDIFTTTMRGNKWTAPENLGYPINTRSYDGHFVLSPDKQTGYFSSRRLSGAGNTDLYMATFSSDQRIRTINKENSIKTAEGKVVTILKGTVIDVNDAGPLEATIRLVDNASGLLVSSVNTSPSGNFSIVIPHSGNFGVTTDKPGYLFNSMNFDLAPFETYQEIDTHILMVKAAVGSKVVLKNIFFDLNASALKPESISELRNIRDLLLQNPGLRVQISGHTDNVGSAEANLTLSLERAEAVVDYLMKDGISPDRLQAKGYGSEQPLVSNDDEAEGREINRRTEIEIIE